MTTEREFAEAIERCFNWSVPGLADDWVMVAYQKYLRAVAVNAEPELP